MWKEASVLDIQAPGDWKNTPWAYFRTGAAISQSWV